MRKAAFLVILAALAAAAGATAWLRAAPTTSAPSIVVTTTMLESAVRELVPESDPLDVVLLIPASSCPGHFDLSPRELPALQAARVVLRHDFQAYLEDRIRDLGSATVQVVTAVTEGNLLVPEGYLSLVRQVASILGRIFPERAPVLEEGVRSAAERISVLEREVLDQATSWSGQPVIASDKQAAFCTWLGLEVVGVIGRSEDLTPRDLEGLLVLEPVMVVGNIQEGLGAAENLAARMELPLAILSAFPAVEGWGDGYDDLLLSNLAALDRAWSSRS